MTEINPLKHIPVGHDSFDNGRKIFEFSNLVIPQHDGTAYEFDIDGFFLVFLQFLLGLAGDIFHGTGVD